MTSVTHQFGITEAPAFSKACLLAQEKHILLEKEFHHMTDVGIIRTSSSPPVSTLHMQSKKQQNSSSTIITDDPIWELHLIVISDQTSTTWEPCRKVRLSIRNSTWLKCATEFLWSQMSFLTCLSLLPLNPKNFCVCFWLDRSCPNF